jgi:hypothetical protein
LRVLAQEDDEPDVFIHIGQELPVKQGLVVPEAEIFPAPIVKDDHPDLPIDV